MSHVLLPLEAEEDAISRSYRWFVSLPPPQYGCWEEYLGPLLLHPWLPLFYVFINVPTERALHD